MTSISPLRRTGIIVAALAALALGVLVLLRAPGSETADRQAVIRERGAAVMPFDLARTTHIFTPSETGGLQQVVAKDAGDQEQVALIQQHLREEAQRFLAGDFADPAAIHGEEMPGLAELKESAGQISVTYAPLPNGAQIRYVTTDATLIAALHDWFAAQLSDHGHDARSH